MDEILKSIGLVLSVIIANWARDWVTNRKNKKLAVVKKERMSIEYTTLINEMVKNCENDIMKVHRPKRMFVFHFYNGEVSEMNLSLKKVAIRHEITLYPGLPYITEHYQGRPIPEMFYDGIRETFKHGHHLYGTDHLEDNPPLRDFYQTWDIQSMLWISINDRFRQPSAIMVMTWPGSVGVNYNDILQIKAAKIEIENIYNEPIPHETP